MSAWGRLGEAGTIGETWVRKCGPLRLTVHRHIYQSADTWFLSVYPDVGAWQVPLKSRNAVDARREAVVYLQDYFMKLLRSVGRLPRKEKST